MTRTRASGGLNLLLIGAGLPRWTVGVVAFAGRAVVGWWIPTADDWTRRTDPFSLQVDDVQAFIAAVAPASAE
ncbi:MAG: hypothetical protein AB8H79_09055 [Myxococcota bacterium]